MVTKHQIYTAIKKLQLPEHYSFIKKRLKSCYTFLYNEVHEDSDYYQNATMFINEIFIGKKMSSSKNNTKKKLFENYLCFGIYHSNEIESFLATECLENFCKCDIKEILDVFDFLNMKHLYFPKTNLQKKNIFFSDEEIEKMFDLYLITTLAQIFCFIEFCDKIAKISIKIATIYFNEPQMHGLLLRDLLMQNTESGLLHPYLNEKGIKRSEKDILEKLLEKIYGKLSHMFQFIMDNTFDEQFRKNLNNDMNIILGHTDTKSDEISNDTVDYLKKTIISRPILYFMVWLIKKTSYQNKDEIKLPIVNIPDYIEIEI